MPSLLSVRNFTSQPLILYAVERLSLSYSRKKGDGLADLDRIKPGLHSIETEPNESAQGSRELNRNEETLNIQIEPCQVTRTYYRVLGSGECLRLIIIDATGSRHVIKVSRKYGILNDLIAADNAQSRLSAIFFESGLLDLIRRTGPKRWMEDFPDETPLQLLSIPGTHNSPTYHRALPSVRCQAVSIRDQLENGVRFLDVRLQVDKPNDESSDRLSLVHSAFSVALSGSRKFRPLYEEIRDFLRRYPSETIVLSLKREGTGDATDADLARKLHDHYIDVDHWMTKPGIPTLGDARGKIVLLRRFNLNRKSRQLYGNASGIDATGWRDNSPSSRSGDVHVQDFYEVLQTENIDLKMSYICDHLERTSQSLLAYDTKTRTLETAREPLFVNFLTGSNFWKKGCWPERIAAKINPTVMQYLCETHGPEGYTGIGVLVCDWVGKCGDWDLVKIVIAMNERLLR